MLLPDLRRFCSAIQTNWVQKELLYKVLPGDYWERRLLATDQGRVTTFRYPCPAFLKGKKQKLKTAGWQQRIPRFWRLRYPTAGKVERWFRKMKLNCEARRWWCRASCPRMSVDILGTNCDQCLNMVQCCFTSTETARLVRTESRRRPPRLSHTAPELCTRSYKVSK